MQNCVVTTCSLVVLGALFAVPTAFADWTWNSTAKTLTDENGIVVNVDQDYKGQLTVSGLKTMPAGQSTLDFSKAITPDGHPIISFGNGAFQSNTSVSNVVFPATLKTMGQNVFRECKGLKRIDLRPCTQLTTIGNYFIYASSVAELNLPDSITSLGQNFAWRNTALTNVTPHVFPNLTTIYSSAFKEGPKFPGDFKFPKLSTLGENAFAYNSKMTSVDFSGAPLTSIGSCAFQACSSLTNVALPSGLTSIGGSAFVDCTKLATVTPLLPPKVKFVGRSAFGYTAVGGDLVLTNEIVNFDFSGQSQNNFRSANITSVDLFGSTNNIAFPNYSFYECKKLTKVRFGFGRIVTGGNQIFNKSPLKEVWFAGPPPTTLTYNQFYYGTWTALSAKIYVPKGDSDWRLFLSTNSSSSVSWVAKDLTQAEKNAFAAKWPEEQIPKQKVCMTGGASYYQYLCYWWPKGNPGFSIIVR